MFKSKILIAASPSMSARYYQAVENGGFRSISPFAETPDYFPVLSDLPSLSFDLLLLPGGGDISPGLYNQKKHGSRNPDYELDLLQFQLLQLAILKRKPVLGICKGMQMINVFFGGDLCQHLPTTDIHSISGGDCYHRLFFSPDFPCRSNIPNQNLSRKLYDLLVKHPTVNSAHHQGISHLGKELCCLQYTEDYVPETILHSSLPILGFQWHPERLPEFREQSFARLLALLLSTS